MKKVVFGLIALLAFQNLFAAYNINQCTGCHGAKFEIKALNGSKKVVADMSELEIAEVLKAYKRGEYGGALRKMMEAQVIRFSDEELESLAKEIKSL